MDFLQFLGIFNPIKNFTNLRYSVGLNMFFNGFPIIFFIRDTLGIGPASSIFTVIFWGLGIIIMIPNQLFLRIYKPNFVLLNYCVFFLLVALLYYLSDLSSGYGIVIEFGNYFFITAYLILALQIPNSVKDTLVAVTFSISLLANVLLVISLLIDPNWTLGMRAAMTFANENAQAGGNPHTAARNAIICIISAGVLIWNSKGIIIKAMLYFAIVSSIVIVILTQTKAAILSMILIALFYTYANFSLRKIGSAIYNFFTFRTFFIGLCVLIIVNYFLSRFYDVYAIVLNYSDVLFDRLYNVYYTITGVQLSSNVSIDASSMGRVSSFELFFASLKDPIILVLGLGYKATFLDVPVLEALINHGILGFIFFDGFLFMLFIYSYKEILNKTNGISLFVAYFFIYNIPQMLTNGRPYDITYWYTFIIMVRFLGIKYLDAVPRQNTLAPSTV